MKPRITVSVVEDGYLEIWMNEQGRDLLVSKLQSLGKTNDHLHLAPPGDLGEIELAGIGYRPEDTVIQHGKILFRTDGWDKTYFPHVLDT